MRKPISSLNPFFYYLSVCFRRIIRYIQWQSPAKKLTKSFQSESLPFRVKKHQSVLIRKLGNCDLTLQQNKIVNLSIAIKKMDGILIKPGETFSFCFLVGKMTKKKGYIDGVLLTNGEAHVGTGGGVCQIANLIHWLVIHSPLTVTERHHHSFDPFPDDGRVIPFGTGATIFYNYIDYQFKNNTEQTFQLKFWLDAKCLNGDLRINQELPFSYHVFEKEHRFLKIGDEYFRQNEIWREKIKKKGGIILETELLTKNFSKLKYIPSDSELSNIRS